MSERIYDEKKADAIIKVALGDLGKKEVPPASNRGSLPKEALNFVGLDEGLQWCAAVACLWIDKAGIKDGPRTGSTGALVAWGEKNGAIVTVPRRGDIGCLKDATSPTGYRHTVMVEHSEDGVNVETIAGNESNRVKRGKRAIADLTFVRPY